MKKFFQNFSILGMIMLMMCVLLGVGDVSGAVFSADAPLVPEGSGVSVEQGQGDGGLTESQLRHYQMNGKEYELIDDPVDQKIVQIRPYANPIDTLLRFANAETVTNFEWEWYQIGTDPVDDNVTNVAVTPNANKKAVSVAVTVATPHLYAKTDTFKIVADDGTKLQLRVSYKSNNVLTCKCLERQLIQSGSNWTIPTITATTSAPVKVYLMGRASSQKAVSTDPTLILPDKSTGYCQLFMMEVEQNFYDKIAKKEVKWDLTEVEEEAMFRYRQRQEGTWLDGEGGVTWDDDKNEYVYSSYGLFSLITKKYTMHASNPDANAEFVDMSKYVFVGNNGAKIRYAICGSEAIANISKMNGTIQRTQDANKTEVVFGITWNVLKTNYGQINFIHHELMDSYGHADEMMIIDPQFVKMKRIHGFERQVINGKEHMIVNSELVVGSEACGLAVYNSAAHCIVKVVTTACDNLHTKEEIEAAAAAA